LHLQVIEELFFSTISGTIFFSLNQSFIQFDNLCFFTKNSLMTDTATHEQASLFDGNADGDSGDQAQTTKSSTELSPQKISSIEEQIEAEVSRFTLHSFFIIG
jgi:hypothetical protein